MLQHLSCRLSGYNAVWSPSGKLLAVMASPKVLVLDGTTRKQLASLTCPETKAVAFSASEQYLHTHQQPHKIDGAAAPNLKVTSARHDDSPPDHHFHTTTGGAPEYAKKAMTIVNCQVA